MQWLGSPENSSNPISEHQFYRSDSQSCQLKPETICLWKLMGFDDENYHRSVSLNEWFIILGTYMSLHIRITPKPRTEAIPWQQKKNVTSYKRAGFFTEMKQKKFQNGRLKKFKMAASKKTSFSSSANSQYFFMKFPWIGPWDSRINWCEGHWYSSTYKVVRLSDISSKTDKKCFFVCF